MILQDVTAKLECNKIYNCKHVNMFITSWQNLKIVKFFMGDMKSKIYKQKRSGCLKRIHFLRVLEKEEEKPRFSHNLSQKGQPFKPRDGTVHIFVIFLQAVHKQSQDPRDM